MTAPADAARAAEARRAVHAACLQLVADGLVVGSAGNVSVRVDEHRFAVSAAGVPYDRLEPDDHPVVDGRDGSWTGGRRPTSELALHAGVLGAMPDVAAVVHTHSRHAAAFAVARLDLPFVCNESIASRADRVLVTDYAPPGSPELGTAALAAFRRQPGSRAVLLANHGVVAIGPTLDEAYLVARSVEWTAEVCHLARTLVAAGAGEHTLDRAVQQAIARTYGVAIADAAPGEGAGASDRDRLIERLALAPLPVEGGWFRQVWHGAGEPPAGTAIVALFDDTPAGFSEFHRLRDDELWHFYQGAPLELILLEPGGASRHVRLGPDLAAGHEPVWCVRAGTWMAARPVGRWSLVGATMAPGYTSDSYEAGERAALVAGWPHERPAIESLTRR